MDVSTPLHDFSTLLEVAIWGIPAAMHALPGVIIMQVVGLSLM